MSIQDRYRYENIPTSQNLDFALITSSEKQKKKLSEFFLRGFFFHSKYSGEEFYQGLVF